MKKKFLKLPQLIVNAEGEKTDAGVCAIDASHITGFRDIWDKHEVIISGCCQIGLVNGFQCTVAKSASEVFEILKELESEIV